MSDFILWKKPRHHPMVCLKEKDNYEKIWLSLWGVNLEKPLVAIKMNGDHYAVDFYEEISKGISHESLHKTMIKLEGYETSKKYDNLFHFSGEWWLP